MKERRIPLLLYALVVLLIATNGYLYFQWQDATKSLESLESSGITPEKMEELERVKKENEALQEENDSLQQENDNLQNEIALYHAERKGDQKIAYLTFDDGPSTNTKSILDTLNTYNVPATFFVNGQETAFAHEMYQRMVTEGHAIGNHTYSHQYQDIYSSKEAFFKDFHQLEQTLENLGLPAPTLVRFPGGSNTSMGKKYGSPTLTREIAQDLIRGGYIFSDWNVDSRDTSSVYVSRDTIIQSVLQQSKGKQFVNVLMHDAAAKTTTAQALPAIIEGLQAQGFTFKVLSKYSPTFQFIDIH